MIRDNLFGALFFVGLLALANDFITGRSVPLFAWGIVTGSTLFFQHRRHTRGKA